MGEPVPTAPLAWEMVLAEKLFEVSTASPAQKQQKADELMKLITEKSASSLCLRGFAPFAACSCRCGALTCTSLIADMAKFYTYCCELFGWKVDEAKLKDMSAKDEAALKAVTDRCVHCVARRALCFGLHP